MRIDRGRKMGDITAFGVTAGGTSVRKITLRAGDLTASILTWGAVLQSVRLAGVAHDLTLGSDHLADYEGDMRHHGALIAPVVNRLSGAQASIAGQDHRFEANQDNTHCLHSGAAGTHLKVWDMQSASDTEAVLTLDLPAGEGGFPGNRRITVRFAVLPPASLRMDVTATTDAPTIFNAANHSYWNLDGSARWDGHSLRIDADSFLPTTDAFTPTGEIASVAGGSHDFRVSRAISVGHPALDNCFCLGIARGPLRDVLQLTGQSGLAMTVATTETGVQLYDGRQAVRPGHSAYEGLAIEAQGWPDAPNHQGFPSIDLMPDQPVCQVTEWRFAQT